MIQSIASSEVIFQRLFRFARGGSPAPKDMDILLQPLSFVKCPNSDEPRVNRFRLGVAIFFSSLLPPLLFALPACLLACPSVPLPPSLMFLIERIYGSPGLFASFVSSSASSSSSPLHFFFASLAVAASDRELDRENERDAGKRRKHILRIQRITTSTPYNAQSTIRESKEMNTKLGAILK